MLKVQVSLNHTHGIMKLYNHASFEAEHPPHASLEGLGLRYTLVDYLDNQQPCTCLSGRKIFEEVIEYGANGQAIPLRH